MDASSNMMELVWAVESLYADEIRPFGRILRKRLTERASASGPWAVDIDVKHLRALCEACPNLHVAHDEGGEWSALLRGYPMTFVDAYSPVDVYPLELWQAAAVYFTSLDGESMVLPGGRYSCAQALVARGLPFLQGRSLGQVSHIVQLAISQKKLLGYLNGAVVPYGRSQSMLKEQCAKRQRPCASSSRSGSGLATMDMVRTLIQEVIRKLPPSGSVPLSNMKRLFRSRFHIELSETALGYAKLSELLQDPCLRDICTVRLQGHGYVICPRAIPAQPCNISLFDKLCSPVQAPANASNYAPASMNSNGWSANSAASQPSFEGFVITEFGGPLSGAGTAFVPEGMQMLGCGSLPHVFENPAEATVGPAMLQGRACRVTPLCLEDVSPPGYANGTVCSFSLPTPSPTTAHGVLSGRDHCALPRLLGSPDNKGAHVGLRPSPKAPNGLQLQPTIGGVSFEAFTHGDVEYSMPIGQPDPTLAGRVNAPTSLLTPSTASMLSVQNTFLHFSLPMTSPCMTGNCRRRSLSQ
jgi:hypothetical protein